MNPSNRPPVNPINLRDLLIDEPRGSFVRSAMLRDLVRRGWPVPSILAELPGVSEGDVRRAMLDVDLAA